MSGDEANLGLALSISEGFGLAPPRRLVRAAEGAMGRVWRLETDTGTYAVKESLRPEDPVRFRGQLEFAAVVSEMVRQAGVQVPEVLRTRSGSLTLTVLAGQSDAARVVRVATWITAMLTNPVDVAALRRLSVLDQSRPA